MYEHKRPLFAFVLVAVICGIVVGTTMKSQALFGVSVPWHRAAVAEPSQAPEPAADAAATPTRPTVSNAPVIEKAAATGGTTRTTVATKQHTPVRHNQSVNHHPSRHPQPVHQTTDQGGRHPGHHPSSGNNPSNPPGDNETDATRGLTVVQTFTGPQEPASSPSASPIEPVEPSDGQ
ncbi:hypothetical protein [Nocardioides sp.]|uniref:hypothetical protein n=1 Tax=Nocardioides sp. TaxID=35761 RepID=UPI003D113EE8